MSYARNFDCLIVIAAVILATAGAATVFSLLHRPVLAEFGCGGLATDGCRHIGCATAD